MEHTAASMRLVGLLVCLYFRASVVQDTSEASASDLFRKYHFAH